MERFTAKISVDAAGGCWNWTGAISAKGYGRFGLDGRNRLAYHVAYELFVGPIPDDGLQFDHTCRNRACVNPSHIERVTPAENTRRGINHNRAKDRCANNHPFDEANTRIRPDGSRACRACARAAWDRWNERRAIPWNGKRRAEPSIR